MKKKIKKRWKTLCSIILQKESLKSLDSLLF